MESRGAARNPGMSPRISLRSIRATDRSIVAVDALAPLVALLGLDRQGRDRPRFQAPQRDRLTGLFAKPVGPVLDALQRSIDLGDQLTLPIASSELDRPLRLRGGAVGEIRMILIFVLQVLESFLCLPQDVLPPRQQLVAEIIALPLVHEGLPVRRVIVILLLPGHPIATPSTEPARVSSPRRTLIISKRAPRQLPRREKNACT